MRTPPPPPAASRRDSVRARCESQAEGRRAEGATFQIAGMLVHGWRAPLAPACPDGALPLSTRRCTGCAPLFFPAAHGRTAVSHAGFFLFFFFLASLWCTSWRGEGAPGRFSRRRRRAPTHVRVCPRRQQAWRPAGARARPAQRPAPRAGEKLLTAQLDAAARGAGDGDPPVLGGAAAFELYDTFGFPLEITAELAAERGVQARGPSRLRLPQARALLGPGLQQPQSCPTLSFVAASHLILAPNPQVDAAGFAEEMDAQKARAKAAARTVDLTAAGRLGALAAELGASEFVGWERMEAPGTIIAILRGGETM